MEGIEVSGVVSWPQAMVAVMIIMAISIVPQVIGYLKTRSTGKKVDDVAHELRTNSGSTVRDAIDRIEAKLDDHITADEAWKTQIEDHLTGGETNG